MSVTFTVLFDGRNRTHLFSMQGEELYIDGENINQASYEIEVYNDLSPERGYTPELAFLARLQNASFIASKDQYVIAVGEAIALCLYRHRPIPDKICLEFLNEDRREAVATEIDKDPDDLDSCVLYVPDVEGQAEAHRYWDPFELSPEALEGIGRELTRLTSKHG